MVAKQPNSLPASKMSNKKAKREKMRYQRQTQARRDSGPLLINVNATNTPGKVRNSRDQKHVSEAIWYNYNKKRYFARNNFKPQKNWGILKN